MYLLSVVSTVTSARALRIPAELDELEIEKLNRMAFPDGPNYYIGNATKMSDDGWINEDELPNYDPNDPELILPTISVSGQSIEDNNKHRSNLEIDAITCEQFTEFCTGFVGARVDNCKLIGGWTVSKGSQLYNSVKNKLLADDKKVLKEIASGIAQGISVNFPNYFVNSQLDKVFVDDGYPQQCVTKADLDALESRILLQFEKLSGDILGAKSNQGSQGYCNPNDNVAQQRGEGNADGSNSLTATLTVNAKAFKTQPHTPAPCSPPSH